MHIAAELRDSIAANQKGATAELNGQLDDAAKSKQIILAQHLQNALSVLQVLILDQAPELATVISDHVMQHILDVATHVGENLAAVVATAQVALSQIDIENYETKQEILKDTFTEENFTVLTEQERKLNSDDEITTNEKKIEQAEHVTETIVEPGAALVTELDIDNAIAKNKEMVDEAISAENVAVTKVETLAVGSEVLVPMGTFVVTEENNVTNETNSKVVDDDKLKEIIVLKTDGTSDENTKLDTIIMEPVSDVISEDELKDSAITVKVVEAHALTTGNFFIISIS